MSPPETPLFTASLEGGFTLRARNRALEAAAEWAGTPHRDRIAIRGRGIDCLHFVAEILIAAGVLPSFKLPFYRPAWGIGRETNIVAAVFEICCDARRLEPGEPPRFGDVIVFGVGHQSNHVGIMLDDREVWHVRARDVVRPEPWADVENQVESVVRLCAEGFKRRPETLTQDDLKPAGMASKS